MSTSLPKLLELAASRFALEKEHLHPEDDFFQKLQIDSLKALEFLSELEMAFDVEIPDYELQGLSTFKGLAELIDRRLC
jgi:acyl carrier protein